MNELNPLDHEAGVLSTQPDVRDEVLIKSHDDGSLTVSKGGRAKTIASMALLAGLMPMLNVPGMLPDIMEDRDEHGHRVGHPSPPEPFNLSNVRIVRNPKPPVDPEITKRIMDAAQTKQARKAAKRARDFARMN
jgi:hypothetical protein